MMDKKILIGTSICAMVLLVLASLTNVVGYQSFKSHTICDSPLFDIRTKRATNNENVRVLTSDYLGKRGHTIQFPLRDNRTAMIQKFIDGIRALDDETYNRFVYLAITQIKNKDNLRQININEFIDGLNQLRKNKQNILVYKDSYQSNHTYFNQFSPTLCWVPGCIIWRFIDYLLDVIAFILFRIYITLSYPEDCNPPTSMSVCCH